ncbi:MAG: response regulator [Phycisphaeraceae bacterium]|nr:MAG: response regulator [Phycisphaeraceae bacterium]
MLPVRSNQSNGDGLHKASKGSASATGASGTSGGAAGSQTPEGAGRLNMLLSYGGWRSDSWAERLPCLLQPMGVRAWRVDSGRDAARLLQSGSPFHIAVVDLRLPLDRSPAGEGTKERMEEGGSRLLELLARLPDPPPTIVVKASRTQRDDARELAEALRRGVFTVVDRPVDLELMLELFRRILRRHYEDRWPGG